MTSGPVVAVELMGDEAVSVWRKILGPTDSGVARKEAPPSLRAQFGTDGTRNAGHGSDSLASAARVIVRHYRGPSAESWGTPVLRTGKDLVPSPGGHQ
uniref:Nucleoside diphosphate kinase n=1 Tax=Hucho hucho TaxID=62062 RepID=A0A4W5KNA8_9TELE